MNPSQSGKRSGGWRQAMEPDGEYLNIALGNVRPVRRFSYWLAESFNGTLAVLLG